MLLVPNRSYLRTSSWHSCGVKLRLNLVTTAVGAQLGAHCIAFARLVTGGCNALEECVAQLGSVNVARAIRVLGGMTVSLDQHTMRAPGACPWEQTHK